MSAYAHPVAPASVRANVYADVHNTCWMYTPAHAWCSQHLSNIHAYSLSKMQMHSCMRTYATVQKILCHGRYCEFILSLAQALCRLSFAARSCCPSCCLDQTRHPTLFAQEIHASSWHSHHYGVVHASFDHPRWCRPHPVCLWVALALGRRPHPQKSSIFAMVFAGCSIVKTTRALPRRDQTTDVARQHDTCRPQGDKDSWWLYPAPGSRANKRALCRPKVISSIN